MPIESIRWRAGRELGVLNYIAAELTNAKGVHDGLVTQWIKWLELYRAPIRQPERNIPFEGASNLMLPTIASDADPLYAKFIQSLHATDNLWTTTALNERWVDAA